MSTSHPAFTPQWAAAVADIVPRAAPTGDRPAISFAWGFPDPALFPIEALTVTTAAVLRESHATALQYGVSTGLPELVGAVLARLRHTEGLDLPLAGCLITSGASQGIGLAARALLEPGDPVLLETPAWPGVLNTLRRLQARIIPVPMDAEGLDVTAAEATLVALAGEGTRPRLLYTVPSFQNPAGLTLSLARRQALLDLARRYQLLILEDEAYRDLAYDGPVPPSLLALDPDGRVLRVGTFSKILAAGLRLGWALGPPEALARLAALKDDLGTSPFTSSVTAAYMATGALEPHIARLVAAYREKRDAMLAALARHFPPGATWTEPAGGFFVWVTLPPGLDSARLLPAARAAGVDFLPGRACFPDPATGAPFIRFAFSLLSPGQIDEGIARLGRVIAAQG